MNLSPGKLCKLNYDRALYADDECYVAACKPVIQKGDIILLLSNVSDLNGHYDKVCGEFSRVKILSSNGDIGYIFYNNKRRIFSEP
jgi:hypothetical protein